MSMDRTLRDSDSSLQFSVFADFEDPTKKGFSTQQSPRIKTKDLEIQRSSSVNTSNTMTTNQKRVDSLFRIQEPLQPVVYYELECNMKKRCPVFPILWQKRFMILKKEGFIYYYLNEAEFRNGLSSRGVISISDLREDLPGCGLVRKGTYLNISVYSKNYRTYYLRLETEEIALEWERAIRGNSETLKKRYSYTDSITLASGL